jgi:MOSC domain-containing protein YiiM
MARRRWEFLETREDVMKILSLNVGEPRAILWKQRTVETGIFKEPVAGRIMLRTLNLDGDRQADLKVHGGPSKAVYAYPAEHYEFWQRELGGIELRWGNFGENLTTLGLDESSLHIGDRLRIGAAELVVTQPRLPCYKLGIRFGRDDIIKRFLESGRSGFYFAVAHEGEIGAGDALEVLSRDPRGVSVADLVRAYGHEAGEPELLARAVQVDALSEGWKTRFRQQLAHGA